MSAVRLHTHVANSLLRRDGIARPIVLHGISPVVARESYRRYREPSPLTGGHDHPSRIARALTISVLAGLADRIEVG